MNNRKIEAVIFDFDGVLANTDLYHFIAWKKAIRKAGINLDPSVQGEIRGLTREATLKKILSIFDKEINSKLAEEIQDDKNTLYKELINDVTKEEILPGIVDFLKYLKENDYKIGVASVSKNSETIIKNIGLSKYIDVIVDPDTVREMKPSGEIFVAAAKLLGVTPWKCVGIEDSQVGIDAINNSFMQSIGIDFHGGGLTNCGLKLRTTALLTPKVFEDFIKELPEE